MTTEEEREAKQICREMVERGEDGVLDVLEERFPNVVPSVLFDLASSIHGANR